MSCDNLYSLDELIDANLKKAFEYMDKVNPNDSVKDNGDTDRILEFVKETVNEG